QRRRSREAGPPAAGGPPARDRARAAERPPRAGRRPAAVRRASRHPRPPRAEARRRRHRSGGGRTREDGLVLAARSAGACASTSTTWSAPRRPRGRSPRSSSRTSRSVPGPRRARSAVTDAAAERDRPAHRLRSGAAIPAHEMFDPRRLAEIAAGPHPAAVCTVVATRGSTPRKAGATMVVVADGSELGAIEGTIGGGAVENQVRRVALEVAATTQPRSFTIELTKELAMCCGGAMTFFVEALRVRPPLIVFGAGHVAQALCRVAATAGFDVHVADPREELLDAERFPDAVALVDDYE